MHAAALMNRRFSAAHLSPLTTAVTSAGDKTAQSTSPASLSLPTSLHLPHLPATPVHGRIHIQKITAITSSTNSPDLIPIKRQNNAHLGYEASTARSNAVKTGRSSCLHGLFLPSSVRLRHTSHFLSCSVCSTDRPTFPLQLSQELMQP